MNPARFSKLGQNIEPYDEGYAAGAAPKKRLNESFRSYS
jgi:hypothetical protein